MRDGASRQVLIPLAGRERLTVGRTEDNDIPLPWDSQASRTHAELALIGASWVVIDDGLSRNGTYLNGERIVRRQRLVDGDLVRVGTTAIRFHEPLARVEETAPAGPLEPIPRLTHGQRDVLIALCRPFANGRAGATPASNREIAAELHLSTDGVKGHMRSLFERLGIGDLPQNRKRAELVRKAFELGIVAQRDLEP